MATPASPPRRPTLDDRVLTEASIPRCTASTAGSPCSSVVAGSEEAAEHYMNENLRCSPFLMQSATRSGSLIPADMAKKFIEPAETKPTGKSLPPFAARTPCVTSHSVPSPPAAKIFQPASACTASRARWHGSGMDAPCVPVLNTTQWVSRDTES